MNVKAIRFAIMAIVLMSMPQNCLNLFVYHNFYICVRIVPVVYLEINFINFLFKLPKHYSIKCQFASSVILILSFQTPVETQGYYQSR